MDPDSWIERPFTYKNALDTPKDDPPMCWCKDICKAKQSTDWDETRGRKFWLCPNYCRDKEEPKSSYDRPKVYVLTFYDNL